MSQPGLDATLREQQKRLQVEKSLLERQLSDVSASLDQVNARIAKITNANAPLYALPNEIITAIFQSGLRTSNNYPILVSHVTHYLREVALGSSTLWRRICVSEETLARGQVDTYLHRSKGCLLEVTVHGSANEFLCLPDVRFKSIFSHITRWRSLDIDMDAGLGVPSVLEKLRSISAPHLEKLRLRNLLDNPDLQLFGGGAPMLSKLILNDITIPSDPTFLPLTTITSLYINESSFSNYNHLCKFLLAAPLLANLQIVLDMMDDEDVPPAGSRMSITLSSLLTFEVLDIPEEVDYLRDICALLSMPVLQNLKLSDAPPRVLASFAEGLSEVAIAHGTCQYPAIRSLEFCSNDLSAEVLKNLTNGLPTVTHITILNLDGAEDNGAVLTLLCDDMAWPHLNTLTIKGFQESNEDFMSILCHVIASRTSIYQLCLHDTGWGGTSSSRHDANIILGDLHYGIPWLRANVHLEYLKVCPDCGEGWDHANKAWVHECEVE
jgi:hypothetical protein